MPNTTLRQWERDNQDKALGPDFFFYEDEEIQETLKPTISILEKIVTEKPNHKKSLQTTLVSI